ncbi:hypothetical protein KBY86_09670 [Synechococcus sp. Lug-A]|uniref:hypothetical protein n=1 Tax=Synechococcus sp. Lug-A TaxID=2823740 RepID=UPI0020CDC08F|nr:hypothetical protein [Synechococcus sp. Lug-A]MCP9847147.1 hypothetical protein [Synechococcus sp. Lug-A]
MQLQAELVHAEPGQRVVKVSAWDQGALIGSALGEAATAELAEDRAIERLQRRWSPSGATALARPEPVGAAKAPPQKPAISAVEAEQPLLALSRGGAPAQAAVMPVVSHTPLPAPPAQAPVPMEASPAPDQACASPATPAAPAHASAAPTPQGLSPSEPEVTADPEDWSDELAQVELELKRLGWGREEEAAYLARAFNHPSRSRLVRYLDLMGYLNALQQLAPGSRPEQAATPLRRRDLLDQSDQLLGQLQWGAAEGRLFLERHFQLNSRQQLNDQQLLQFNMLLEDQLATRA